MKKPIYNQYQRWQIINIKCLDSQMMILNIALLKFIKLIKNKTYRLFGRFLYICNYGRST